MSAAETERLARMADCLHVNLTGDRAMALERLQRFASLAIADFIARTQPLPIMVSAASIDQALLRDMLANASHMPPLLPAEPIDEEIAAAVAAEREACAQVLDAMAAESEADGECSSYARYYRTKAAAIRARGAA